MVGAFACPECGSEVASRGATAGRTVRCRDCGTLVEIPFLARSMEFRARPRRSVGWMWAGAGVAAALVMVTVAVLIARGRGLANREREVAQAVSESESAEAVGRFDEALALGEKALTLAKSLGPATRAPLKARRDRLALRDLEARLAAADATPDPVVALRSLLARLDADPALEPARDGAHAALKRALGRRAETDLSQAAAALASGHPEIALSLCERVADTAHELGYRDSGGTREAARNLARQAIGRLGATFAPVKGEFLPNLGTPRLHAQALQPLLAGALKAKGYLPRPESSAFLDDWDESAPYRVTIEVTERNDGAFFQTPLHTTRIDAHVVLSKAATTLWEVRPKGATRVPPPSMSSFEMSHLSLAKERDPAVEKRLYDDARAVLSDSLAKMLGTLPRP